jgi:[protein-PII] uridylyltransferase
MATGPAAWSPWKAELVAQLVERVRAVLEGGSPAGPVVEPFPSRELLGLLSGLGEHIEAAEGVLTVVTDDHPGIFSRVAGVLALHGLDVLSAVAHSSDDGRAVEQFKVADPRRDVTPWPKILADIERALAGRLALPARLAERVTVYLRGRHPAVRPASPEVAFDNQASDRATVIDVHAADGIGVLYRITRALAELDLDIQSARVQTLGAEVVDAFYVRDRNGRKVHDPDTLAEIERAIVHSLVSDR